MSGEFIAIISTAAALTLALTPWIIGLARRIGAMDLPGERKIHSRPTPRLGGAAVWIGFGAAIALALRVFPDLFEPLRASSYRWDFLGTALAFVVVLGILDDIHSLRAEHKLVVQLLVGTLVYAGGVRIEGVGNPFGGEMMRLGLLAYPVTLLWIVGVTNAFNLIDGLDGLASGVALISALTIFTIAASMQDPVTAAVAIALAGSVLGFLPFNFYPARIFLGDSGSLFLGFSLSVLSIHASAKGPTAVSLLVPVFALGLPIMDTVLSTLRRLLKTRRVSSVSTPAGNITQAGTIGGRLRAVLQPDRDHIHHRLMAIGISHRSAVIILYMVSCAFGFLAFAISARNVNAAIVLALIGTLTAAGVSKLGYREMAFFGRGIFLPLFNRPLVHRRAFHLLLDFAFIAGSFCASYLLLRGEIPGAPRAGLRASALALTCLTQLAVFSVGGIYRGSLRVVGLGDLLRTLRTVLLATLASATLMEFLFPGAMGDGTASFWILDFYLLASAAAGLRLSYHVLNYLSRRGPHTGRKVLIYGANASGLHLLRRILDRDDSPVDALGFLDDDPSMEGTLVDGYPVYGGHWKLRPILRNRRVDEIIFSDVRVQPEVLRRIRRTAANHGVTLRGVGPEEGTPRMGRNSAPVGSIPVTLRRL